VERCKLHHSDSMSSYSNTANNVKVRHAKMRRLAELYSLKAHKNVARNFRRGNMERK